MQCSCDGRQDMCSTTWPQLIRRMRLGGTWGNSWHCTDAMGARVPDARITLCAGARTCKLAALFLLQLLYGSTHGTHGSPALSVIPSMY